MIVASTMLLTVGLQLNQVIAESNYNQPYALPLNSRVGSLNEDFLSSNEIDPFKTKSGQNIDGSYNTFQANPGSGAWSDFEGLGGGIRSNSDPAVIANSDGRLEVFVVGADNQLWHKWQTSVGTGEPDLYDDFEGGSTYSLSDGQISPNGKWKSLYAGFGTTGVIQEPGNKHIHLQPMTSTSPGETHGAAVATTTSYKDFSLTLDVITKRQLRQNSPANNWETAWLNWNAIDQFHAYGFTLKVLGFQLEKKDNNNQDDGAEIYLITQNSPSVKMNTWQTWQIMVSGTETGTPRIQVWIDGTRIVDYVDNNPAIPRNSETMKQGGPIVLYTEDAAVGFDNVKITPL
ncbi:MAG: family 16 glycoside hydrolase [Nitrososphaeraceae archaeon]